MVLDNKFLNDVFMLICVVLVFLKYGYEHNLVNAETFIISECIGL